MGLLEQSLCAEVGSKLKLIRERQKKSMAEVSRKSGIGMGTLRTFEAGTTDVRVSTVMKLMAIYGISWKAIGAKVADAPRGTTDNKRVKQGKVVLK